MRRCVVGSRGYTHRAPSSPARITRGARGSPRGGVRTPALGAGEDERAGSRGGGRARVVAERRGPVATRVVASARPRAPASGGRLRARPRPRDPVQGRGRGRRRSQRRLERNGGAGGGASRRRCGSRRADVLVRARIPRGATTSTPAPARRSRRRRVHPRRATTSPDAARHVPRRPVGAARGRAPRRRLARGCQPPAAPVRCPALLPAAGLRARVARSAAASRSACDALEPSRGRRSMPAPTHAVRRSRSAPRPLAPAPRRWRRRRARRRHRRPRRGSGRGSTVRRDAAAVTTAVATECSRRRSPQCMCWPGSALPSGGTRRRGAGRVRWTGPGVRRVREPRGRRDPSARGEPHDSRRAL